MTVERPSPDSLTARERAAEVTALLARAILRLHATLPDSGSTEPPVCLGFLPEQRVHTNPLPTGVPR